VIVQAAHQGGVRPRRQGPECADIGSPDSAKAGTALNFCFGDQSMPASDALRKSDSHAKVAKSCVPSIK